MTKGIRADAIKAALCHRIPPSLVEQLVEHFIDLQYEVLTRSRSRSAGGKFIEAYVQILQHLQGDQVSTQPSVDSYLNKLESKPSLLDPGLRLCAARIARSIYTLRNKRSIAHIGDVDPNNLDLLMMLTGCQWLFSELIRVYHSTSMDEAALMVKTIQAPVDEIVEDEFNTRIVLDDLPVREEVLILLQSYRPEPVNDLQIKKSLERRSPKHVSNTLNDLWKQKLIHRTKDQQGGRSYALTSRGYARAQSVLETRRAK